MLSSHRAQPELTNQQTKKQGEDMPEPTSHRAQPELSSHRAKPELTNQQTNKQGEDMPEPTSHRAKPVPSSPQAFGANAKKPVIRAPFTRMSSKPNV